MAAASLSCSHTEGRIEQPRRLGHLHGGMSGKRLLEQGEFEDRDSDPECGIKTGWWRLGWVPFVSNGRGDHLCLDLDPDADGKVGQVIEVSHDVQERCLVSSTFSEWLATEVQLKCHD